MPLNLIKDFYFSVHLCIHASKKDIFQCDKMKGEGLGKWKEKGKYKGSMKQMIYFLIKLNSF